MLIFQNFLIDYSKISMLIEKYINDKYDSYSSLDGKRYQTVSVPTIYINGVAPFSDPMRFEFLKL